jgi:hypothetical protein
MLHILPFFTITQCQLIDQHQCGTSRRLSTSLPCNPLILWQKSLVPPLQPRNWLQGLGRHFECTVYPCLRFFIFYLFLKLKQSKLFEIEPSNTETYHVCHALPVVSVGVAPRSQTGYDLPGVSKPHFVALLHVCALFDKIKGFISSPVCTWVAKRSFIKKYANCPHKCDLPNSLRDFQTRIISCGCILLINTTVREVRIYGFPSLASKICL